MRVKDATTPAIVGVFIRIIWCYNFNIAERYSKVVITSSSSSSVSNVYGFINPDLKDYKIVPFWFQQLNL